MGFIARKKAKMEPRKKKMQIAARHRPNCLHLTQTRRKQTPYYKHRPMPGIPACDPCQLVPSGIPEEDPGSIAVPHQKTAVRRSRRRLETGCLGCKRIGSILAYSVHLHARWPRADPWWASRASTVCASPTRDSTSASSSSPRRGTA